MTDGLARLQAILAGTAQCADSLKRSYNLEAVESSRMREEERVDTELVGRAYACAYLLLVAVQDHLESLSRLLDREPVTQFGFAVLTRAALENASRAAWLLDPDIDVTSRMGRGLTVWADSLRELAEVHDATGDAAAADSARRGIDALRGKVAKHGLEIIEVNRFGVLGAKDHQLPTASKLAADVLEHGRTDYRVLSAYTHGATYALLQNYDFKAKGVSAGRVPGVPLSKLAALLSSGVASFCFAFNLQVKAYGWDQETWAAWSRHALESLHVLMIPGLEAEDEVRRHDAENETPRVDEEEGRHQ